MSIDKLSIPLAFMLCSWFVTACSSPVQSITPTAIVTEDAALSGATATLTESTTKEPSATEIFETPDDDELVHLWAETGILSPFEIPGVATGPPSSSAGCGNEEIAGLETDGSEIYLTLHYEQNLIPLSVNLLMKEAMSGIDRVETLNTQNGLGREVFNDSQPFTSINHEMYDCTVSVSLPIDVDFDVNTVIIGFNSPEAASNLDAVELVGIPLIYEEPLVYWRITLPAPPVALSIDPLSQVIVATEDNSLLTYDIEGNLLNEVESPTSGRVTDMAVDPGGNLVLSDGDFGEWVVLSPEGEIARGGGEAPAVQVAVGSGQENIYMLGDLGGLYYLLSYLPGTFEIINPLPLDGASYAGLSFNPDNQLYTMRDQDGFLVEIDPRSGQEINSIPLREYDEPGTLPVDLTIDREGNFYVLLRSIEKKVAVRVYDSRGFLLREFGRLLEKPQSEWPEGSYFEPKALELTPDARFALIIDGDGEESFLTCLLLRSD